MCPGSCLTIQRTAWPLFLERKLQFLKTHLRKELATHSAIMPARSLLSSISNSIDFSEEMTITKQNGWEDILPKHDVPSCKHNLDFSLLVTSFLSLFMGALKTVYAAESHLLGFHICSDLFQTKKFQSWMFTKNKQANSSRRLLVFPWFSFH